MPLLTLREAYEAWDGPVEHYLREPTDAELANLMPVDHPIDLEKMTVGEVQDFQKNLWHAKQKRDLIGMLRKETAFARRNEHHVLNGIFGKEFYNSLNQEQKDALKARFAELNEAVKAEF